MMRRPQGSSCLSAEMTIRKVKDAIKMANEAEVRWRKAHSDASDSTSDNSPTSPCSASSDPSAATTWPNGTNTRSYKTATEYSQAVHQWLVQYHMWNQMNWFYMTFPMQLMNMRYQSQYAFCGQPSQQNIHLSSSGQPNGALPSQPSTRPSLQQNAPPPTNRQQGNQFKIPPLWKRITAEFIDFFLLFITKLAVTIFFVEYVGLIDLQRYDLENLMTPNMDYNTAFAMTSELVAMEIVNRVFICVFETLCLRQGLAGTVGGTTPGKRMMGLKVISCREVSGILGRRVLVSPAGNIGTWNAFVRSLIKNFSLAFFFPVCLTVFFFQHNRAAYDIISNSIVVEIDPVAEQQAR